MRQTSLCKVQCTPLFDGKPTLKLSVKLKKEEEEVEEYDKTRNNYKCAFTSNRKKTTQLKSKRN